MHQIDFVDSEHLIATIYIKLGLYRENLKSSAIPVLPNVSFSKYMHENLSPSAAILYCSPHLHIYQNFGYKFRKNCLLYYQKSDMKL